MDDITSIITGAIQGETDQVIRLITKLNPLIKKCSRKLNYEEAETDIIIKILEKLPKCKLSLEKELLPGQLFIYICTMIERLTMDLFRKQKKRDPCICYTLDVTEIAAAPDIDIATISFNSIIANLTKDEQEIIILRYRDNFSDAEIAKHKNTTRQNICNKRNHALRELIKELE